MVDHDSITHHTDTSFNLGARTNYCKVITTLLLKHFLRWCRCAGIDIQFCYSHIESQICKSLQVLLKSRRNLSEGEVALETNAVNWNLYGSRSIDVTSYQNILLTIFDHALNDIIQCIRFGINSLNAIIVYAVTAIKRSFQKLVLLTIV